MTQREEISLVVPAELVRKCAGLALDFGGSVLKIVYRSTDNDIEVKSDDAHYGHLQLVYFPRSEFSDGLDYIKMHARLTITEDGKPTEVLATGLGCTQYGNMICEKINIKLHNVDEFECFVKAFIYLAAKLSRDQLFEPCETEVAMQQFAPTLEQMAVFAAYMVDSTPAPTPAPASLDQSGEGSNPLFAALGRVINDSSRPVAEVENLYPCVLAMCGSGYGFLTIGADGKHKLEDGSFRGGRTFFGLGSLLTGCKTYEELLELASKGNGRNVDMYSDELFVNTNAVDGDETMYSRSSNAKSPTIIYSFGKCPGAKIEDFKREDLAAAILKHAVLDVVQTVFLCCTTIGIHRVFFCGSLINSRLVRQEMTRECVTKNLYAIMKGKPVIKFDFVQPGAHLGAIGALIS